MLRLIGLVVSIGLADSLNPTTIVPAIYLATGEHPRRRVIEFILGVLAVYLLGGALIALGPGELLIDLLHKPGHTARHVLEAVIGLVLVIGGWALCRFHRRLVAMLTNRRASVSVRNVVSIMRNAPPYGFALPGPSDSEFCSMTALFPTPSTSRSNRKQKKCW